MGKIPMVRSPLGWLLGVVLRKKETLLQFEQTLTAEQITAEIQCLLGKVKHCISPDAYTHLESIQATILSVLETVKYFV